MASNHILRETARLHLTMLADDRGRFLALERYYVRIAHEYTLSVDDIAIAANMSPERVRRLIA